jgi:hypothetical protein
MGPRAVMDAVVKRKIPSLCRESNHRTPMVQSVAQRYTDWLENLFLLIIIIIIIVIFQELGLLACSGFRIYFLKHMNLLDSR